MENKVKEEIEDCNLEYCPKDYKKHHYWELIGVWGLDYILYKCSQCHHCKLVKINFVNGNHVEEW